MVLSLHKQPFVTAHFQFITAHFVRHCALKNALLHISSCSVASPLTLLALWPSLLQEEFQIQYT